MAGYFLAQGRQRLGIASGDDQRASMRRKGFVATVGRDVPTAIVPAPSSRALGREALTKLLQKDAALEAVFCSSDQLAQGLIVEAQARGLRVPEDIAVCGFGDAEFAAHMLPSLTTVHVDGVAIGRHAARLILQRCNGERVAERIIDVGFRVVERASTAIGRARVVRGRRRASSG